MNKEEQKPKFYPEDMVMARNYRVKNRVSWEEGTVTHVKTTYFSADRWHHSYEVGLDKESKAGNYRSITVGNDQIKELEVEGKCPTCEAETVIHVRSISKDQNNNDVHLDLLKCSNCGYEWTD